MKTRISLTIVLLTTAFVLFGHATAMAATACGDTNAFPMVCSNEINCTGACVNTANDPQNCGGCGAACTANQFCANGMCQSCATGQTLCGTTCVDTQTDAADCGACGTACARGYSCVAGACTALCAVGETYCTATETCADLTSDPNNCGACGTACGGMTPDCSAGVCVAMCPTNRTLCSGACVNTANNPADCGACGTACAAGQTCGGGVCAGCTGGQTLCGTTCVDLQTDADDCGRCGNVCVSGTCTAGACTCGTNLTACDGTCVDTGADPTNCGGCGTRCTANEYCAAGVCTCQPGFSNMCGGGVGAGCNTETSASSADCGACGMACGMATPDCANGMCSATCAAPLTLCMTGFGAAAETECVDTQTDPSNCGGCGGGIGILGGHVCAVNQACIKGVCEDYAPVQNAGCSTCPCAACATALDYASCCTSATLGAICLNGASCP